MSIHLDYRNQIGICLWWSTNQYIANEINRFIGLDLPFVTIQLRITFNTKEE
jgi:hypothetical protein